LCIKPERSSDSLGHMRPGGSGQPLRGASLSRISVCELLTYG
jgi:hypothetical protein